MRVPQRRLRVCQVVEGWVPQSRPQIVGLYELIHGVVMGCPMRLLAFKLGLLRSLDAFLNTSDFWVFSRREIKARKYDKQPTLFITCNVNFVSIQKTHGWKPILVYIYMYIHRKIPIDSNKRNNSRQNPYLTLLCEISGSTWGLNLKWSPRVT